MEKIFSIVAITLVVLSFASCDSFLDIEKEGSPTQSGYFQNDRECIEAVDAVYQALSKESFTSRNVFAEQGCTLDWVWGRSFGMPTLMNMQYTGDESWFVGALQIIYKQGINRTNWVIESLLNKQKEKELTAIEKRSLGECYFMRAFYHFYAAYRYGTTELGVPFVAYEDVEGGYNNSIPPQLSSVIDNYKLIIADFQKAEELLPKFEEYDANDRGRAHKASAVAMMARTYAYWATWDKTQWANVIPCVDKLENQYGRDLHPNFRELFSPDYQKGFWNKEYIWGMPSQGGESGTGAGGSEYGGVCLENKGWGKVNGWGQFKPTLDIYNEMAKDNVEGKKNERLAVSILEYGDEFQYFGETRRFYSASDLETGFMQGKWIQAFAPADPFGIGWVSTNSNFPCTRVMFHFIRFADCLLLRAEANLVAGNAAAAAADINRIRKRSLLAPLVGNATWTDLYHERRCELAFELGHDHGHDCKRWVKAGNPEIAALALHELTSHPRIRIYADRLNPDSPYKEGDYEDSSIRGKVFDPNKHITLPYPSSYINESAGALKNVSAWQ